MDSGKMAHHISMKNYVIKFVGMVFVGMAILLMDTGCVRISLELHPEEPYLQPRQKIFSGTHMFGRALPFVPILFLPEIVFEVIADVVFLPVDGVRCAYYAISPPLGQIIHDNDLETLKKRLESNEDPNLIDMRYSCEAPINAAHSLEAVEMLLEHGAKLTPGFLSISLSYDTAILRYITQNGYCKSLVTPKNTIVYYLCKCLSDNEKIIKEQKEKLSLLLECGFSPNAVPKRDLEFRRSALDYVKIKRGVPKKELAEIIALLEQYGALSYADIARENPAFPHFQSDGGKIDPIFKRAEDLLYKVDDPNFYVVSTTYSGISGPVLVIDRLRRPRANKQTTRKSVKIHRRETPVSWCQAEETIEIPVAHRIVLTPPGVKMPSRLQGKYPDYYFMERWFSLDDYEVYEEINTENHRYGESGKYSLEFMDRLLRHDEKKNSYLSDIMPPKKQPVYQCDFLNVDYRRFNEEEKDNGWSLLEYANTFWRKCHEVFQREKMGGKWFVDYGGEEFIFSSHRTKLPHSINEMYLAPDEIMLCICRSISEKGNSREVYENSRQNRYYRNWIVRRIPTLGCFFILYGDEVSDERLKQIEELTIKLLEDNQSHKGNE